MIALDTSFLILLLEPGARPPLDPSTGKLVANSKQRVEYFIAETTKTSDRILVPTPALAEFLVGVRKHGEFMSEIKNNYRFKVGTFDEMAAVELALLTDADIQAGKKRSEMDTKAKVKFDRQIVAIAKVNGAHTLCCDDNNLADRASKNGLKVIRVWDLQLPPSEAQGKLPLSEEDGT